jgi:hypothetical protein
MGSPSPSSLSPQPTAKTKPSAAAEIEKLTDLMSNFARDLANIEALLMIESDFQVLCNPEYPKHMNLTITFNKLGKKK